ncbi:crosslink repair DNA glycosylase YcaQ family protein [uncultured Thermanaerothrix sp.]|uniref:AlkZ-related protein n=1 Tax=uncultured Thermanaerothrix sp. TaxID=1195149 RepID=UPI00262CD792|nr:crosslink repair DNA glycosylase YcaQ family protein [uncultured Thermanaerothrix sp.]
MTSQPKALIISDEQLTIYRAQSYRYLPSLRLRSRDEAIHFVNERGFVLFWPAQGLTMPSLWVATAGNRPVADAHDDPGHICWDWKDSLLGKRVWYYARVLRGKNTLIALDVLPYFYALSPNYGDPEHDYLDQYRDGLLTLEAKQVYEALLNEGPLDTLALRRAARLNSPESTSRFERALTILQTQFRVLPVGTAEVGAWRYAFVYDVTHRHFPELLSQAATLHEDEARAYLLRRYLLSVGAINLSHPLGLFGWRENEMQRALRRLERESYVLRGIRYDRSNEEWIASPEFFAL